MEQDTNKDTYSNNDDILIYKAELYWTYGLITKIWGGFVLLSVIPVLFIDPGTALAAILVFMLPAVIVFIKQKKFALYITNSHVILEEVIALKMFAVTTRHIPLAKINDVIVEKNPIFPCGNILLLTGNEKAKPIKAIKDPEIFRDKLKEVIKKNMN